MTRWVNAILVENDMVWVPKTSSRSRDQLIFVYESTEQIRPV